MNRKIPVMMTAVLAAAVAAPLDAETVTSFAPSSNTDPGVWYESFVTSSGMASIVDLSGAGGDLENNQPLPVGAARLTTTTDNNDRANVGVFDAYGAPGDILATLALQYSSHKASNGTQNLAAAPALKLTIFNATCDDPMSAGDCFGTLVFEPTWNQPGFEGSSTNPPLDTWQTWTIDGDNGLFWWTGGFGQPNTAGGPPLRTLNQWLGVFSSDFADADIARIEIGVGSFNQNQLGYFDDVQISHAFGGGYSASYDFEAPVVTNLDTGEDFASLQSAIDDADTLDGHTLQMLVDDHTTPETQIVVSKDLTIQGGSPDTLRPSANTGTGGDARGWFLIPSGKTVTFRDLIFDGTGFLIWQGIRSHGTLTVEDCAFTEIKYNPSSSYQGTAIATFDTTGPLVVRDTTFSEIGRIGVHLFSDGLLERCTYTGKGVGDWLDYFSCIGSFGASVGNAEIRDCTVSGNRGVASSDGSGSAGLLPTTFFGPGTTAEITGCTLTDNSVGLAVGFDGSDTSSVTANFNCIFGNDFGVVNTATSNVVDARENWWGDAGGPDDPPGSVPAMNMMCAPVGMIFNMNSAGDSVTDGTVEYCPWSVNDLCAGPTTGDLTLEVESACIASDQVAVEVWARDLTGPVTGFQAFIAYDTAVLSYNGGDSSYTGSPFALHIQDIVTAEVAAGEIRIDGSVSAGDPGTVVDSLLATLVFDVDVECTSTAVDFDLTQMFDSELSFEGDPIPTTLVNTGSFTADDTPPVLDPCPADIMQAADADGIDSCAGAVVTFTAPDAMDNCDGMISSVCTPASGSFFPVGTATVTCTATDSCGNETSCMFDVTVEPVNVVCLDVQLVGVTTATTRCIHFVTDDCNVTVDVELDFDSSGLFSGTIEVPCGEWTQLCAKDEQHTKWDTADLVLDGDKYALSPSTPVLELRAGDTDNDGDVDINDVTLLLFQFGGPEPFGGCPWDGTRGADFNNDGTVSTPDYSLLTPEWLTISDCDCTTLYGGGIVVGGRTSVPVAELEPWLAARADMNTDGVVDYKDVSILERQLGLPDHLSRAIRHSAELRTSRTTRSIR